MISGVIFVILKPFNTGELSWKDFPRNCVPRIFLFAKFQIIMIHSIKLPICFFTLLAFLVPCTKNLCYIVTMKKVDERKQNYFENFWFNCSSMYYYITTFRLFWSVFFFRLNVIFNNLARNLKYLWHTQTQISYILFENFEN